MYGRTPNARGYVARARARRASIHPDRGTKTHPQPLAMPFRPVIQQPICQRNQRQVVKTSLTLHISPSIVDSIGSLGANDEWTNDDHERSQEDSRSEEDCTG